VLAGGSDGSRNANAEVWEWDGSTWTNSLPALPEARDWPGLVYDPDTDRLLLVGGNNAGSRSDTWVLNGPGWQQLVPDQVPRNAFGDALVAIDPGSGRPLCVTQSTQSTTTYSTFEHDGVRWIPRPTTTSPTAGGRLLAATDRARARLVAVGSAGLFGPGGT